MSLHLREVKKSYVQGHQKLEILRGLNLEIKKSEVIAILGQSGSGKSTLLTLLAGLDTPDSGEIEIAGIKISHLSPIQRTEFRGKKIGIVFQQYHLLSHLKALENVALPLEIAKIPEAIEKSKIMLEQVGLAHRRDHFPSQMSGGECQRVAIARALVTRPEILLADEPSGNLDVKTGEMVMRVFMDIVRKNQATTILVTHSLELANLCDRKLHLVDGVLQS